MMTMSGRVTSCCVALFLALTSVSAVPRLRSINALKKINFGQSVPKHSLVLLYWFANTIYIDNNNILWLTFDPNDPNGDYGSHHYGNFEGLLDPLPQGNAYRYYTIGNLYQDTSMPLPPYVVSPPTEYVGRNRDRIIIRVREPNRGGQSLQSIDQVYITQHYDTSENQGTPYDPDHTYMITTNLLRQIREFSVGENQQQLLQLRNRYGSNADEVHIRNTWGGLACLGLLLFIVIQEKHSSTQHNKRPENNDTPQYRPQNRRNQWAPERESNVPRKPRNQDYVVVHIDNNDDRKVRRTVRDRQAARRNISVPTNNNKCSFCCKCCICCTVTILLIVSCTILFFWYKGQLT